MWTAFSIRLGQAGKAILARETGCASSATRSSTSAVPEGKSYRLLRSRSPARTTRLVRRATGEAAFNKVCSACHGTGINGAPKVGDHAAWAPRIAQGKDALYKSAIGGKNAMPPKGGTNWPDATIRMTVDYMVSLNK